MFGLDSRRAPRDARAVSCDLRPRWFNALRAPPPATRNRPLRYPLCVCVCIIPSAFCNLHYSPSRSLGLPLWSTPFRFVYILAHSSALPTPTLASPISAPFRPITRIVSALLTVQLDASHTTVPVSPWRHARQGQSASRCVVSRFPQDTG